jgi:SAM-dependent methyltransferase
VAWPAAIKIAVDPLLYVYQKLGMLLDDVVGTTRTVHLAVSAEELPLLDECADLVICRNALDHMPAPARVLQQIWRILKPAGGVFLSVDIGGVSTPDEPTVFSADSLAALLRAQFEIVKQIDNKPAHSGWRPGSVRILARKKPHAGVRLDKEKILRAYMARLGKAE